MIKHFLGEKTLTVVVGDRPRSINRDHPFYSEIVTLVADPQADEAWLLDLLDPLNPLRDIKIDGGSIEIHQTTVTRNGEPLPAYLQERIVDAVRAGLPIDGWKLFVERTYANPSFTARDELAKFMDKSGLSMTPEGKFLAFKRVREDYGSIHANPDGTHLDNSIGRTVVMPGGRKAVNADRNSTCSVGLHVCSQKYLSKYYSGTGRIVIVEVDPADVVSVPYDCNNTKARVWRYTVVGEVPLSTEEEAREWGVISLDYLNREALEQVEANIVRLNEELAGAIELGDSYEADSISLAIKEAGALRQRILDKLAEDQRKADEAYAEQLQRELDAAEELAKEYGVDVADVLSGDWVEPEDVEDDPDDMTLYPMDPEFERLLAEEEEIERAARTENVVTQIPTAEEFTSVANSVGASGVPYHPSDDKPVKKNWAERLKERFSKS